MIPVGKYKSPRITSHGLVANGDGNNLALAITFEIDPGDGGVPEETVAKVWMFKKDEDGNKGAILNDRSVETCSILGYEIKDVDDIWALNREDDSTPLLLYGDNCSVEIKEEKWVPDPNDLNEYGNPREVILNKIAWINRLGAAPVETIDKATFEGFRAKFTAQLGGIRERKGARLKALPRKPDAVQVAQPAPSQPALTQPAAPPAPSPVSVDAPVDDTGDSHF